MAHRAHLLRLTSQYPPHPAKDCRMSLRPKASAIEATSIERAASILELFPITSASSSID
jgi:hypothetical protein